MMGWGVEVDPNPSAINCLNVGPSMSTKFYNMTSQSRRSLSSIELDLPVSQLSLLPLDLSSPRAS